MEVEYINEDTIRVRIKNTDLEARGYTFLDLLGNQQQIEEFFYKILEEVDLDNQFRDSEAVTFQVMPSSTGLELLISKDSEVHEDIVSNVDFENFDELFLEQELEELDDFEDEEIVDEDEEKIVFENLEARKIIIEFSNFEQLIQLAQTLKTINGFSSLYQLNDMYYVDFYLVQDNFSFRSYDEIIGIILEYGKTTELTSDILAEHADLLIEGHALNKIYHYFQ